MQGLATVLKRLEDQLDIAIILERGLILKLERSAELYILHVGRRDNVASTEEIEALVNAINKAYQPEFVISSKKPIMSGRYFKRYVVWPGDVGYRIVSSKPREVQYSLNL